MLPYEDICVRDVQPVPNAAIMLKPRPPAKYSQGHSIWRPRSVEALGKERTS